jgi:hypothetical protein
LGREKKLKERIEYGQQVFVTRGEKDLLNSLRLLNGRLNPEDAVLPHIDEEDGVARAPHVDENAVSALVTVLKEFIDLSTTDGSRSGQSSFNQLLLYSRGMSPIQRGAALRAAVAVAEAAHDTRIRR